MMTEYSAVVVESNGGRGLGSESYTLVSVDHHGLFTVKRQTEPHKVHHVHLIDWGLGG